MSDSGYTPSMGEIRSALIDATHDGGDGTLAGLQEAMDEVGRQFDRAIAAYDAVTREDERKLQAERDAAMLENMTCILHNDAESRGFYLSLDAAVRNIRGQSFTGTESEQNG